jgi:hypothetical protein
MKGILQAYFRFVINLYDEDAKYDVPLDRIDNAHRDANDGLIAYFGGKRGRVSFEQEVLVEGHVLALPIGSKQIQISRGGSIHIEPALAAVVLPGDLTGGLVAVVTPSGIPRMYDRRNCNVLISFAFIPDNNGSSWLYGKDNSNWECASLQDATDTAKNVANRVWAAADDPSRRSR